MPMAGGDTVDGGSQVRGSGLTRRAVVAGTAAALAGCIPGRERRRLFRQDEDGRLRTQVVLEKRAILERYTLTAAAHPELTKRLRPLAADHEAHLGALGAPVGSPTPPPTPGRATAPPGLGTATPTPSPIPPAPVPASPTQALAALAALEAAAAKRRVTQCVAASGPTLARVLASIGGAEAAHAALLGGGT